VATAADATVAQAVTLTADKTSVSGSDLAVLTATVRLTDPQGVTIPSGADPAVRLQALDMSGRSAAADPQANNRRDVLLSLASGTDTDGDWVGQVRIGAINAGDWQITGVRGGSLHAPNDFTGFAPYDGKAAGAEAVIAGSHWPVLSVSGPATPTASGGSFTVRGRAVWSDTGAPVTSLPVAWAAGAQFAAPDAQAFFTPYPGAGFHVAMTDANGVWTATGTTPGLVVTAIYVPQDLGPSGLQWVSGVSTPTKTVKFAVTVTVAGRRISGRVSPNPATYRVDAPLTQLQKSTSTGWRVIATSNAGSSYSFTVGSAGRYRVAVPGQTAAEIATGYSASVVVR